MRKTKHLFLLLMAIVMIAMSPMKIWAISGSGTSGSHYKIASATDWANSSFQSKLSSSSSSSPVYIDITADFTVTSVMLRDKEVYIVLDGQGHTITLSSVSTTAQNTGLFGQIGGGEVKNLHIAGNMGSSEKYMGNLCGRVKNTLTVTNVICSASISGDMDGDATAGGFVGQIDGGTVTFNQCGFTYRLYGHTKADKMCGMVGYRSGGTVVFNNCFCKAEWVNPKSGDNYAYMRNDGSSTTYNNCYYVTYGTGGKATDKSSGGPTQIVESKFGTGELAYKLNGSSNGVARWYQNLSGTTDGYPFPYTTSASTHAKVYYGYDHGATSQTYNNSSLTKSSKHQYYNSCTPTWSDTDTPASCKVNMSYKCSTCNGTTSESLTPTYTITKQPACATDGSVNYSASSTTVKKDASNYYSATTTATLNRYKHGYEGYTSSYAWSGTADAPVCKFTLKCNKCSTTVVNATSITTEQSGNVAATCTAKGSISYKAKGTLEEDANSKSFTDSKYTSHTYGVAALGHDYKSTAGWAWDNNYKKVVCTPYCTRSGCTSDLAVTLTYGNGITSEVFVTPTCTERGKERFTATYSPVSGVTFTDNAVQYLAALGHDFDEATDPNHTVCTRSGCNHTWLYYTSDQKLAPTHELDYYSPSDFPEFEYKHTYSDGKGTIEFYSKLTSIKDKALRDIPSLKSIIIPVSVTSIGVSAFSGCIGLSSITIPSAVESIGEYAFYKCTGLKGNLVIPNSVKSIGRCAFQGCTGLDGNLTLSSSLESIGNYAFYQCANFKGNLVLPNTVKSIGEYAFSECSGFTGDLLIPNSVMRIGEYAFSDCSGFDGKLTIPNSEITVGRDALYCSNVKVVQVEKTTVMTWATNMLSTSRKTLKVPSDLVATYKTTDDWKYFPRIYCIEHPSTDVEHTNNNVATCGEDGNIEYWHCKNCEVYLSDAALTTEITQEATIIPATGNHTYATSDLSRDVCTTCNHAFLRYTSAENKEVGPRTNTLLDADGNTVNIIRNAYNETEGMNVMELDKQVVTIGKDAFHLSPRLTELILPATVTAINESAFQNCTNLARVTFPSSVTYLGNSAFQKCTSLTCVTIPASITSNGTNVFADCDGITDVIVEHATTYNNLGGLFYNQDRKILRVPSNLVGAYKEKYGFAIVRCIEHPSVSHVSAVPATSTTHGNIEYWHCATCNTYCCDAEYNVPTNNLDNYVAHFFADTDHTKDVCTICNHAFLRYKCPSPLGLAPSASYRSWNFLDADGNKINFINNAQVAADKTCVMEFEKPLGSIGPWCFQLITNLTSVTIPNTVTSIGDYAFYQCTGLTGELTIPNSVTSIGEYAFESCAGLSGKLVIPASVASIGKCAFHYCYGLTGAEFHSIPMACHAALGFLYENKQLQSITLDLTDDSYVYTGSETSYFPSIQVDMPSLTAEPTYTREMSNAWGTIVVPFAVTYNAENTNHKLFYLSSATTNALRFTEYEHGTSIPAGTPMAIKAIGTKNSNGKYKVVLTAKDKALSTAITPTDAVSNYVMDGTFSQLTEQTGMYFIANNKFYSAEDPITINPFRAWFENTSGGGAKALDIFVEEETDGISNLQSDNSQLTNGKYLENGKVVILRNGARYNVNGQTIQ